MVERCQLLRREYVLHIKSLSAEIHNQYAPSNQSPPPPQMGVNLSHAD